MRHTAHEPAGTNGNAMHPHIPMPPLRPDLPPPPLSDLDRRPAWKAPSESRCAELWDRHDMPEHIRAHSAKVARIATALAEAALKKGLPVCLGTVRASALLHDIAKAYCIRHGGSHAQLGAAWAMAATGNPLLAQGVMHHVSWPFAVDLRRHFTPLVVLYADKRVAHDQIVPLAERFGDLLARYGKTEELRRRIHGTNQQAQDVEDALAGLLDMELSCASF